MKNTLIFIAVLALGGAFYFYSQPPQRHEPFVIGVAIPLTGIASLVGEAERDGIQLATDEINAAGGIDGRMVKLVIEDDGTDPTKSVSAIKKLIDTDHADVLIGGTWDFIANAVIPVLESEKRVMISAATLPDSLERPSQYLFEDYSSIASNQSAVERYLAGIKGDTVVTISINNTWGQAHLAMFKAAIAASGKGPAKEVVLPDFDSNDLQAQLTLIKPLQPDVILIALNFADSPNFLAKKVALGVSGKVLAHYNLENAYENGSVPKSLLNGVTVFAFSNPTSEFAEKFMQTYGKAPPDYADTAYDAVYLYKAAIENAHGKTDTDSVIAGLRKITDYQGASGRVDFSHGNYPTNKTPLLKTFDGTKFVTVQ